MKLLLRTSRLLEKSLFEKDYALDRKRPVYYVSKNAYSFYFSLFLVLSSFIPLFFYIYLMCLFLFVFPSSYSCVSFIASQRTHRFVARIFRKRTMIYEDPWRVMSKSSRIAVSTKGTNMIVYHRVCACMCARVCDCVRVRVPTLVV